MVTIYHGVVVSSSEVHAASRKRSTDLGDDLKKVTVRIGEIDAATFALRIGGFAVRGEAVGLMKQEARISA